MTARIFFFVFFLGALFFLFGCSSSEDGTAVTDCGVYGFFDEIDQRCFCNKGYGGEKCDQCAEGYINFPKCSKDTNPDKDGLITGTDSADNDSFNDSYTDNDSPVKDQDTATDNDAAQCDNSICGGHGKCIPGQQKCNCNMGYAGDLCDKCTEGYIGYPDCYFKVCSPGDRTCKDDKIVSQCNEKGDAFTDVENCADGYTCYLGKCLNECEKAESSKSYVGCEYWGAYLQNGAAGGTYALVVANPNDTDVTVTIYKTGDAVVTTGVVPAKQLSSFDLGAEMSVNGAGKFDFGYKLVASRPVTVTQMNPFGNVLIYSNDATLLLPKGALTQKYYAMSWPTWRREMCSGGVFGCGDNDATDSPGFITISAVEPGTTTIAVTYAGTSIAGGGVNAESAGAVVNYTLSQYQVLNLNSGGGDCPNPDCSWPSCDGESFCYAADLTGSYIVSDKKIAVFGGSACTFIPAGNWACDHMEHQIFPLETWGKEFVAVRTEPRGTESDYWRILAFEDGTNVSWKGGVTGNVTLGKGKYHDFSTTADFAITSDKPILVGQFLASEQAGAGTGDPSMMLLAPNEQLRKDYIFLVPPNYDYHHITIVSPTDNKIKLDGADLDMTKFTAIPDSPWTRYRPTITEGAHTLVADKPVGLYVYGFSQYVSYGYIAGLDLQLINQGQ